MESVAVAVVLWAKNHLSTSVIINPAPARSVPFSNTTKATNHNLAHIGGGAQMSLCFTLVCARVSVRGLINVESNAARDTHTP